MVYTGYVGQFYEVSNATQFYLWGTISTVFFLWVLVARQKNDLLVRPTRSRTKRRGLCGVYGGFSSCLGCFTPALT